MSVGGGSSAWAEFERQRRVLDQMLTQHARLRDRYRRRRLALVLMTMTFGLLGAGFAFASNDVDVTILGVQAGRDTWLGVLGLFVLLLGIIDLATSWDEAAHAHREATSRLSSLKARYRDVYASAASDPAPPAELGLRYAETMDLLVPIPDRSFNPLKAAHLRKVEVSKRLSARPGSLSWTVWLHVVLGTLRHR